jgi:Holliday junction resolvase RusA-like endonuclease
MLDGKRIRYVILGSPPPLARPRFSEGQKRPWDSQRHAKIEWQRQLEPQHGDGAWPFYQGPLRLDIYFYFPIPKTSEARTQQLRDTHHFFRPDNSNVIKFLEDCAQGILFKDDCTISEIHSYKLYDIVPRSEFTITPLVPGTKVQNTLEGEILEFIL